MTQYLHLHVKGYPQGYYEEKIGWKIVDSVPQSSVKFLAGTLDRKAVEELREQSRKEFRKPLPIFE